MTDSGSPRGGSFGKIVLALGVIAAIAGGVWFGLGRSEFEDILERLGDSGAIDKHARAQLLERLDEYLEPLSTVLQDPKRPTPIRSGIAQVLGESQDPRAVEPLGAALGDSNRFLREAIVHALGALSLPECIPHLARALSDSDAGVRQSAVNSLVRHIERNPGPPEGEAHRTLRNYRKRLPPNDPLRLQIDQVLSP